MFFTFQLLPQLKTGRSEPVIGDFFSQIAPCRGISVNRLYIVVYIMYLNVFSCSRK